MINNIEPVAGAANRLTLMELSQAILDLAQGDTAQLTRQTTEARYWFVLKPGQEPRALLFSRAQPGGIELVVPAYGLSPQESVLLASALLEEVALLQREQRQEGGAQ